MREIKFRAWAKYGEMLPNVQNHIGGSWSFGNMLMNQDEFVVMQYTGLKDANGVEIYEGDLIDWLGRCWDIIWDESDSSFLANSDGGECESGQEWSRECKVIGNIYENPELKK